MDSLVQIGALEKGWHRRKMKETGDEFEAKKLGTAFYLIRTKDGNTFRHLVAVVEQTSEEIK